VKRWRGGGKDDRIKRGWCGLPGAGEETLQSGQKAGKRGGQHRKRTPHKCTVVLCTGLKTRSYIPISKMISRKGNETSGQRIKPRAQRGGDRKIAIETPGEAGGADRYSGPWEKHTQNARRKKKR